MTPFRKKKTNTLKKKWRGVPEIKNDLQSTSGCGAVRNGKGKKRRTRSGDSYGGTKGLGHGNNRKKNGRHPLRRDKRNRPEKRNKHNERKELKKRKKKTGPSTPKPHVRELVKGKTCQAPGQKGKHLKR